MSPSSAPAHLGPGLVQDDDRPDGQRNKSISLKLCRNVTLRDFTIQHGGWFGILATGVDNLTIDNLKIDTNRDGMDIDCCRERPRLQLQRQLARRRRHLPEKLLRAGLRPGDRERDDHELPGQRL